MDIKRTASILIGVLFILGALSGATSAALTDPIRTSPNILAAVYAHEAGFILASVMWLTMGLALAMIPVATYPLLKKFNPTLAMGYVVFRGGLESVTFIIVSAGWLVLLPLRPVFEAGSPDGALVSALGATVFNAVELGSAGTIAFSLGALMFYYMLYRTKIVPRWISGWGPIAAIPYLAGGVLGLVGVLAPTAPIVTALDMPLALKEMVLAVWLIAKGFTPAALQAEKTS
jgi:hypothetical protein